MARRSSALPARMGGRPIIPRIDDDRVKEATINTIVETFHNCIKTYEAGLVVNESVYRDNREKFLRRLHAALHLRPYARLATERNRDLSST